MISDTDIVTAYVAFLGRMPSEAEIEVNRRHSATLSGDVLLELQRSLVDSQEFRTRRLRFHKLSRMAPTELDQPRLVFVHIEKCGGTTLHAMLESQFAAGRICPERQDGLGDWTINELAAYTLFSGHFDLSICRSIPGPLRLLTMLREPKARLLSLYYFWHSHRPDPGRDAYDLLRLARALPIEAFFSHPTVVRHTSIRNAITGQLTRTTNKMLLEPHDPIMSDPAASLEQAWAALQGFAGFGIVERFEQSRLLLNRALGLQMTPIAPRQVLAELARDSDDLVQVERAPVDERLDALLEPLTTIDTSLYGRALALFEQRVLAMDAADRPVPASPLRRLADRVRLQRRNSAASHP